MSDILQFGDGGGCKDNDDMSPLPLVASIGDGDSLDEEGEGRCVAGHRLVPVHCLSEHGTN